MAQHIFDDVSERKFSLLNIGHELKSYTFLRGRLHGLLCWTQQNQ